MDGHAALRSSHALACQACPILHGMRHSYHEETAMHQMTGFVELMLKPVAQLLLLSMRKLWRQYVVQLIYRPCANRRDYACRFRQSLRPASSLIFQDILCASIAAILCDCSCKRWPVGTIAQGSRRSSL